MQSFNMRLSIIVAAAENNVIGHNNALIWRLSADLKHFKALTTGHAVIMGRKTYESIGKALPNRRNIVISSNPALVQEETEAFIIGGGSIYAELWNRADRLYLTRVHANPEGETVIPAVQDKEWKETKREAHAADEKNEYAYTFIDYCRP